MASSITSRKMTPKSRPSFPMALPRAAPYFRGLPEPRVPPASTHATATPVLGWNLQCPIPPSSASDLPPPAKPSRSLFLALGRPPRPHDLCPDSDTHHLSPGLLQWLLMRSRCPASVPGQRILPTLGKLVFEVTALVHTVC